MFTIMVVLVGVIIITRLSRINTLNHQRHINILRVCQDTRISCLWELKLWKSQILKYLIMQMTWRQWVVLTTILWCSTLILIRTTIIIKLMLINKEDILLQVVKLVLIMLETNNSNSLFKTQIQLLLQIWNVIIWWNRWKLSKEVSIDFKNALRV